MHLHPVQMKIRCDISALETNGYSIPTPRCSPPVNSSGHENTMSVSLRLSRVALQILGWNQPVVPFLHNLDVVALKG